MFDGFLMNGHDRTYWFNLGEAYGPEGSDSEIAFDAAKSDPVVWKRWTSLSHDEQEEAAEHFANGYLWYLRFGGKQNA